MSALQGFQVAFVETLHNLQQPESIGKELGCVSVFGRQASTHLYWAWRFWINPGIRIHDHIRDLRCYLPGIILFRISSPPTLVGRNLSACRQILTFCHYLLHYILLCSILNDRRRWNLCLMHHLLLILPAPLGSCTSTHPPAQRERAWGHSH